MTAAVVIAAGVATHYASSLLLGALLPGAGFPAGLFGASLTVAVSFLSYALFVRLVEGRRPAELSFRRAPAELLAGILGGAALVSTSILLIWLAGGYRILETRSIAMTAPVLIAALLSGFIEEILARGVVLRIAEEALGSWPALGLSSLLFGLLHWWNPHASAWTSLVIAAEAGLLLGAAYLLTSRLWLPIGIHLSWNYTLGGIFGAPVSGHAADGLVEAELSGPALISGGAFGPEASIFMLAVCLPAAALMLCAAKNKGNVRSLW